MARKDFFSSGHTFEDQSLGEIQWKETSLFGSGVALVDAQGNTLAQFCKRMKGRQGDSGFEIFRSTDPRTLDMLVVTGLGAAEYLKQSNKEWSKFGKDILEDAIGI
jgi:hypothetical protein